MSARKNSNSAPNNELPILGKRRSSGERAERAKSPPTEAAVKKRIRRSKDARAPRNYLCGCGKTYLSYAALYTHTKTKHGGVFPDGTTTLSRRKQIQNVSDDWRHMRSSSEYQRTYDLNKDFQLFLAKIPGALDAKEKRCKNLIEFFPCEIFKDIDFCRCLLLNLEQIRCELIESYGANFIRHIDVVIFEINNPKKLNCYQAIALFLIYVFRFCSRKFYRDLVFLFVSFVQFLNDHGWKALPEPEAQAPDGNETQGECEKSGLRLKIPFPGPTAPEPQPEPKQTPTGDFCETQTAEVLPNLANEFIVDYFMDCISTDLIVTDTRNLSLFRMESTGLLWVILLLKFFFQWLFIHRFSKAKVEIHKD